ncbi:MAG: glycosyltransferase family 9 protein [Pseudomonadota bacterium]|nr:glycosyltransferase family 9 protein [Pseudomonadota bacterium]
MWITTGVIAAVPAVWHGGRVRILVISANRLGDAVLTCGVLDHLARTYPNARFTIACGPAAAGVYARMPGLERIIVFDKRKNDSHWPKLWRDVVFTWWDLVVDFRGSALGFLIPARRRVVRRKRPGRMFEQHAAMLGIDPAPLPVVWTAEADRARAAALLPAGRPVIGFGVTANWAPKMWAAERFAALFERLSAGVLPGAVAAVFAGPGAAEREMAAPALALLPGAIDLRGALTIPEAAAVIKRCALYVGNDSGLMHLAAATGTPTVGLCGTTRDRAAEMAPAGVRAVWAEADASTMEALTVEAVEAACRQLLG